MRLTVSGSLCALLVSGCGDPVAPPTVTSKAFDITVELLTKRTSRSADNRDVYLRFTIRNPLPVRATMQRPAPKSNTDDWWAVYLVDVDDKDRVRVEYLTHHGPITLAPGEARVDTVWMHVYQSMTPARYRVWGGRARLVGLRRRARTASVIAAAPRGRWVTTAGA